MKRIIEIELDIEQETDDLLDKIMGRIYTMTEINKTGMDAKFIKQENENDRPTNSQD